MQYILLKDLAGSAAIVLILGKKDANMYEEKKKSKVIRMICVR
jgi:hypothetical protein